MSEKNDVPKEEERESEVRDIVLRAKKSTKYSVAPDFENFGLFRKALRSRKNLRVTACAVALLSLSLSAILGRSVMTYSQSPGLNILVNLFLFLLILATGYVVALATGDIIFPHRWRQRMADGIRFRPRNEEEQKAFVNKNTFSFALLIAACTTLTAICADFVSGHYFSFQFRGGSMALMLRSSEADDRLVALRSLPESLDFSLRDNPVVREEIIKCMDDDEEEIRLWSAFLMGKYDIAEKGDDFLRVFRNEKVAEVRRQQALALGRLKWRKAVPAILSAFRDDPSEAYLLALSYFDDQTLGAVGAEFSEACAEDACDVRMLVAAFYLVKKTRYQSAGKTLLRYVTQSDDNIIACSAADALRFALNEEDIDDLYNRMHQTVERHCDEQRYFYPDKSFLRMVEEETLRGKLVRAIGNHQREKDYDKIRQIGLDEAQDPLTRKIAESYIRGMRGN